MKKITGTLIALGALASTVIADDARMDELKYQYNECLAPGYDLKSTIVEAPLNIDCMRDLFGSMTPEEKQELIEFGPPFGAGGASIYYEPISVFDVDFVEFLLANGADPNAIDEYGKNALHYLVGYVISEHHKHDADCREKSARMAKVLIDSGVDVNYHSREWDILLNRVVEAGLYELAEILIEAEAKVNCAGDHGMTPLHYAAMNGDKDAYEFLVKAGADEDALNSFGQTARDLAPKDEL